MGCAVSSSSGQLRNARQEVEQLRHKLDVAEREAGDLRRRLEEPDGSRPAPPAQAGALGATPVDGPSKATAACSSSALSKAPSPEAAPAPAKQDEAGATAVAEGASAPPASAEAVALPGAVGWEQPLPAPSAPPPGFDADGCQDGGKRSSTSSQQTVLCTPLQTAAEGEAASGGGGPPPTATISVEDAGATSGEAGQPNKQQQDFSGKVSNSVDSDASTCTPAVTANNGSLICHQCSCEGGELFIDPSDLKWYCERCWTEYYGQPPSVTRVEELQPLVTVEAAEIWQEERLAQAWAERPIPGWPPLQTVPPTGPLLSDVEGEVWENVAVRVRRDIVGPHAREQSNADRPFPGEVLMGRYRCKSVVGEGHFTKAFLAEDLSTGVAVCLKRHRSLTVEALADLLVLGRRMSDVDPGGFHFPRLVDAFYDLVGFTVESLLEGQNCLAVAMADPKFFTDLENLHYVACGALSGLVLLDQAGVVHNDVKPDNLIWMEVPAPSSSRGNGSDVPRDAQGKPVERVRERRPLVKIVDFGCARLDHREEPGRNWSLAEGGAGHLGKWSPEMSLRLPITHRNDVWGLAVSICELHCGRFVWRNEADTAEVVLAQSLGLCNLTNGLPTSLMRKSPLDIRLTYSPAPRHLPLRRNALGQLEALQPEKYGLEQVLGDDWPTTKADLGNFLETALVIDPQYRPSARELRQTCRFVTARGLGRSTASSAKANATAGAAGSAAAGTTTAGAQAALPPPETPPKASAAGSTAATAAPKTEASVPPAPEKEAAAATSGSDDGTSNSTATKSLAVARDEVSADLT